jgi:segregation and condensation protein B
VSDADREPIPAELLVPTLGAVIFASGEPVSLDALGGIDAAALEAALGELARSYEKSDAGLQLERVAGGYRLATRPDTGAWVRRFFQHHNRTRLTPAALETLADPTASLKSLLDKKMIRILGKKKVVGSPLLYGTRREFLVHFGLDSLSELPSIDEFDEFIGRLDGEQAALLTPPSSEPEYEPLEVETGLDAELDANGADIGAWPDDGPAH